MNVRILKSWVKFFSFEITPWRNYILTFIIKLWYIPGGIKAILLFSSAATLQTLWMFVTNENWGKVISCGQAGNQNILFVGLRFSIHDVSQLKIASNLSRDCNWPVIEEILMIICSLHAFIYLRLYTILDIYLLNKFSLNSGFLAEIIVLDIFKFYI